VKAQQRMVRQHTMRWSQTGPKARAFPLRDTMRQRKTARSLTVRFVGGAAKCRDKQTGNTRSERMLFA
jgi:hypothetical protein